MKEDCMMCGVTFESDVPATICPECDEELWDDEEEEEDE